MKNFTKLVLLLFFPAFLQAQNICTNGGFETYTALPNNYGQSCYASGWFSPSGSCNLTAGWGSPDYFNQLTSGVVTLPTNYFGTVMPHTGTGIMGFTPYYAPNTVNYREYIERQFSTAMQPGVQYNISFWLTNGASSSHNDGIKNIGVYFSTSAVSQAGTGPILLTPQLEHTSVFYSTAWQQFTFTFTPTLAYNYITIGNFHNDAGTTVGFFGASRGVYYFIDDIVVTPALQLPVELIEFTATENNGVNQLHWETASEKNSSYFVIERSEDGIHFDSIGIVYAAGNSNSINLYDLTDPFPFPDITYYRLRQYDMDGTFEYSKIIYVKAKGSAFSIYQDPTGKLLTIHNPGYKMSLDIYSLTGATVFRCESEEATKEIDLSHLADGIYFLRATGGTKIFSQKILLW